MSTDTQSINRWLQSSPVTPIGKVRSYFVLPVFSYDTLAMLSGDPTLYWLGSANRVTIFNYTLANNFTLKAYPSLPASRNFVLTIGFRNADSTITRYKIWTGSENELDPLDDTVPVSYYNGELIKKNFFLEIWSTETNEEVSLSTAVTFYTSILYPVTSADTPTALVALASAIECNTQRSIAPALVTGAYFRYMASVGVTLTAGKVSQWNDQSGNARHLTQGTAGKRPVRVDVAEIIGGKVIQFDGVDDNLSVNGLVYDFTKPFHMFIVFRKTSNAANKWPLAFVPGGEGLKTTAVNNQLTLTGPTTDTITSTGFTNDTFFLVEFLFDNVDVEITSFLQIEDQAKSMLVSGSNFIPSQFVVGSDQAGANNAAIEVAEILAYNKVLSVDDLGQIKTYLRQLYFISFAKAIPVPMHFADCSIGGSNT